MRSARLGSVTWLGLAAIGVTLWAAPRGARACSCMMPPPPAEALDEADAVFEARPFSMSNDDRRAYYSFEVDRVWKGEIGPRVEIATALHSAACGRTYQIGTRYVVYARRNADGDWADGLCSRTRASLSAEEDLQVLGAGHAPISGEPAAQSGSSEATEPPRITTPPPAEPPPTAPGRRGCAMEKPHTRGVGHGVLLLGLAVAIGRRRAVRSPRRR
ncbi:MAG: hypothetical protein KC501_24470 [Myxococcales bacterium]|nr:hypothetical protein [Myxococcales bacterium]